MIVIIGQTYRTGSTFIQRLINVCNEGIVYGEQNGLMESARSFLQTLHPQNVQRSIEQWEAFKKDRNTFSANLSPSPQKTFELFKTMIQSYIGFGEYDGFKILSPTYQAVSAWNHLFTDTKYIFCTRDPEISYQSYKQIYDYVSKEKFFQYYQMCINRDEAVQLLGDRCLVVPYEKTSYDQCLSVLKFLGLEHHCNKINKVLNLKLREVDGYVNRKTGTQTTDVRKEIRQSHSIRDGYKRMGENKSLIQAPQNLHKIFKRRSVPSKHLQTRTPRRKINSNLLYNK